MPLRVPARKGIFAVGILTLILVCVNENDLWEDMYGEVQKETSGN